MINARVGYSQVNSGIRGTSVNARVSSFQSGIKTPASSTPDVVIPIGTAIGGLLLTLTYATTITIPGTSTQVEYYSDDRPNARIMSN